MGYGMMGNMFGYGFNFDGSPNWLWLLGSSLINLLIIIGVFLLVYKIIKNNRKQESNLTPAKNILKERYVIGEINEEEYRRKLKVLK